MSNNSSLTFNEVIKEFVFWHQVFSDILSDIDSSKNKLVLYNIDFSYLFDYIWDFPAVAVPAWVPGGRQLFEKFIKHSDKFLEFKLVFTGPSYYELLDSIKHQMNQVQGFMYSSGSFYERLSKELESNRGLSDVNTICVKSGVSSAFINYLPTINNDSQLNYSFEKIRKVFRDQNTLKGIADFVNPKIFDDNWRTFKNNYDLLLNTMLENPRWNEKRTKKHRKFHYGVDSSNIVATINSNLFEENFKIFFVTQNYLRNTYCTNEGRSPYVPYFRVTAKLLEDSNIILSSEDYFASIKNRLAYILRVLKKTSNLSSIPKNTERLIVDFFQEDMRNLGSPESIRSDSKKNSPPTIESIRRIFRNKDDVEETFDKAKMQLESMGEFLVSKYSTVFEKDPISKMMEDDDENPVMKEIRESFTEAKERL